MRNLNLPSFQFLVWFQTFFTQRFIVLRLFCVTDWLILEIFHGILFNFRHFPDGICHLRTQKRKWYGSKGVQKILSESILPKSYISWGPICIYQFHTFLFSHYFILPLFYYLFLLECFLVLVTLKILDNWPKESENNSQLRTGERNVEVRCCWYMRIVPGQNKTAYFHGPQSDCSCSLCPRG